MTNQIFFNQLLECIKVFVNDKINFPDSGEQKRNKLVKYSDENEKFELIINRKGHLNINNLTYVLISDTLKGAMVRLDCNGAPHEDVDTPHIHIFDDEHDNGRIAIGLSNIEADLENEIIESLIYFLDYNKIDYRDIDLPMC